MASAYHQHLQQQHQQLQQQQQRHPGSGQHGGMHPYMNYPLRGIPQPHAHDVLMGRGGQSNTHPGNTQWRTLVAANKELYVSLPKKQKMLLSQSIVNAVRTQNPPGRFLQKDKTDLYYDVGDKRAQEKTSQALREGAPEIREKLKESKKNNEKSEKESTAAATTSPKPDPVSRNSSGEQMPPPVTIPPPVLPPPIPAQGPVSNNKKKKTPVVEKIVPIGMDSFGNTDPPKQPLPPQHVPSQVAWDPQQSAVPPPPLPPQNMPVMEEGFSCGSMQYLSDAEHAKLMAGNRATAPQPQYDDTPLPVDGGLDQHLFSFGSVMSIDKNLERGGTFGSAMSVSVVGAANHIRNHSGVGAPNLEDIGTSFGSLSLMEGERERFIAPPPAKDTSVAAAPPILAQQKSRGDLLDCGDSSSDDDSVQEAPSQPMGKSEFDKMKAALAMQNNTTAPPPPLRSFDSSQQYSQQQQQQQNYSDKPWAEQKLPAQQRPAPSQLRSWPEHGYSQQQQQQLSSWGGYNGQQQQQHHHHQQQQQQQRNQPYDNSGYRPESAYSTNNSDVNVVSYGSTYSNDGSYEEFPYPQQAPSDYSNGPPQKSGSNEWGDRY